MTTTISEELCSRRVAYVYVCVHLCIHALTHAFLSSDSSLFGQEESRFD